MPLSYILKIETCHRYLLTVSTCYFYSIDVLSEMAISFSLSNSSSRACWKISALTVDILTHPGKRNIGTEKLIRDNFHRKVQPLSPLKKNALAVKIKFLVAQWVISVASWWFKTYWLVNSQLENNWRKRVLNVRDAKMPPALTHCKLFHCFQGIQLPTLFFCWNGFIMYFCLPGSGEVVSAHASSVCYRFGQKGEYGDRKIIHTLGFLSHA